MGKIKVRKIGNSVGIILPKELGLRNGDLVNYKREGNLFILDTSDAAREHDRQLIEQSFQEFEKELTMTEEDMKKTFGKYGWGE
jgi:antitoxin component of MazEF toxin-antitoxin module